MLPFALVALMGFVTVVAVDLIERERSLQRELYIELANMQLTHIDQALKSYGTRMQTLPSVDGMAAAMSELASEGYAGLSSLHPWLDYSGRQIAGNHYRAHVFYVDHFRLGSSDVFQDYVVINGDRFEPVNRCDVGADIGSPSGFCVQPGLVKSKMTEFRPDTLNAKIKEVRRLEAVSQKLVNHYNVNQRFPGTLIEAVPNLGLGWSGYGNAADTYTLVTGRSFTVCNNALGDNLCVGVEVN